MDTAQQVAADIGSRYSLSDAEIAERVGSSQPTIWRIRSGKSRSCTDTLYRALCQLRLQLEKERDGGQSPLPFPDQAQAA